jgi:hypothetical protein
VNIQSSIALVAVVAILGVLVSRYVRARREGNVEESRKAGRTLLFGGIFAILAVGGGILILVL